MKSPAATSPAPPAESPLAPGRDEVEETLLRSGSPLLYRVDEVAAMLGLSRSVIFELLGNGRLRSVREGRARRVRASAVLDYVRLLEREADGPGAG